jgi:hypothetical protein
VTAGTIFDRTRTPLTVWFTAYWLFTTAKDGISALSLQRSLDIGSYQTAWAMLGRLWLLLVRPGPYRLARRVEVDETYIGGEEPGLRGGRARGKKVLTGIAVEVKEPKGIGRCRMALLADGSSASLHPFVTGHVEPGAKATDLTARAARAQGTAYQPLAPGKHASCSPDYPRLTGTDTDPIHQDGLAVSRPRHCQDHRRSHEARGRPLTTGPGRAPPWAACRQDRGHQLPQRADEPVPAHHHGTADGVQDIDRAPGSRPVWRADGQGLPEEAFAAVRAGQAAGVKRPAADAPIPGDLGDHDPHPGQCARTGAPAGVVPCSRMSAARCSGMPVTHCELWL